MQQKWDPMALIVHASIVTQSFLVTIMGLVTPWSLTLAPVDVYSVFFKLPPRQPGVMSIIVVGDWVLSFLSLAAACSMAGVTNVLINSTNFCHSRMCSRCQLSAAMTFLSWTIGAFI